MVAGNSNNHCNGEMPRGVCVDSYIFEPTTPVELASTKGTKDLDEAPEGCALPQTNSYILSPQFPRSTCFFNI